MNKYKLGIFDVGKLNKFLTIIPILVLFIHILLTGGHEVGAIYYYIGCRIIKLNRLLLVLIFFPLLVANLIVNPPCIITVIVINTPFVNLLVAGHCGCYQILHVWNNMLFGDSCWYLFFGLILWVPTRTIYLWPVILL